MGTRNLTMVVSNGKTKVAQYGQWDGYPSGQGVVALRILKEADLLQLKDNVDKCEWVSDTDIEKINANPNWSKDYPWLSRDAGASILRYVLEEPRKLVDKSSFAADSLFCEYGYVVDFDKNTFEVYEGFTKSPINADERFFGMEPSDSKKGYYPIRLAKSYSLSDLPTEEQFLNDLEQNEEDDNS